MRLPKYRTGKIGGRTGKKNKALYDLKMASRGHLTFERINSVTLRVDSRNKRGVAWLMEVARPGVARQRWVACVGKRRSEPLALDAAKTEAEVMLRDRSRDYELADDINRIAAFEFDRAEILSERREATTKRLTLVVSNPPKVLDTEAEAA